MMHCSFPFLIFSNLYSATHKLVEIKDIAETKKTRNDLKNCTNFKYLLFYLKNYCHLNCH